MINSTPDSTTIQIPLSRGYVAIVDLEDSDLSNHHWHISTLKGKPGYASGRIYLADGGAARVYMHRIILEKILRRPLVKGEMVDHINSDKLDNRRSNLRLASKAENMRNTGIGFNNLSGYKGVHRHGQISRWVAQIKAGGQTIHLGCFVDKQAAARAYNEAALRLHGEFARLNIIPDSE